MAPNPKIPATIPLVLLLTCKFQIMNIGRIPYIQSASTLNADAVYEKSSQTEESTHPAC
ncbi:hypothetical protein BDV33DRAFT_185945 [Aspergillus novoparasiticus]|uniref:Uncharacterized protein n=1 Tax=Aspergillus novoparasiticus TaxID=986946 RepID=A0A5N6E5P7_9EURO|nr:hypothetical protein BDV33DRAFT_185945 [Aspergillus novoparasiticus]